MKTCRADGCSVQAEAKGLCNKHYMRLRRHGHINETKGRGETANCNHPLYRRWAGIKQRCNNKNNRSYKRYGGRGIKVCKLWTEDFWAFVASVGLPPSSLHSLDRIDVNGDYEPGNVRWATPSQQSCNRRNNVVTHEQVGIGRELKTQGMSYSDISKTLGADYDALRLAIQRRTFHDDTDYSNHPVVKRVIPEIQKRGTCSHDGCDKIHYAKGFCRKHYRWRTESKSYADQKDRKCDNCGDDLPSQLSINNRFCSVSCKMKWHRKYGSYTEEEQKDNPKCIVEGCDRVRQAQGLCRKHYMLKWHEEKKAKLLENAVKYLQE